MSWPLGLEFGGLERIDFSVSVSLRFYVSSLPLVTCSLSYLQVVLENSSREDKHECPFGRSSIELTKMLCEILKVGELRKYTCFPCGYKAGQRPAPGVVAPPP